MPCRLVRSLLRCLPCQLPPVVWSWCALILVSVCDTNVLARALIGRVVAAQDQRPEKAGEDGENDADNDDACETPSLTHPHTFSRHRPITGIVYPLGSAVSALRHRLDPSDAAFGLLPPPIPLHAGAALPLRC